MEKSQSERLQIVNETKMKLLEHELEGDMASKVLWKILDNYVKSGNPVDTILYLKGRKVGHCHYVVKLYNDRSKTDVVLIRSDSKAGAASSAGTTSTEN